MFRVVASRSIRMTIMNNTTKRPRSMITTFGDSFQCQKNHQAWMSSIPSTLRQSSASSNNQLTTQRNVTNAATTFLTNVTNNRVPKDFICQKVEDILLKMLQKNLNPKDGPIALDLLNVAVINANLPQERLIPRLFSLACQVMVGCGHPLAFHEIIRQIWRLLDNHKIYLTNDLEYNSHHVNDACSKYIHGVLVESKKSKQNLPPERRKQSQRLMARLQKLYEDPTVPLVANADSCNAFIMFLCNQEKPREAQQHLQWMVDVSTNYPVDIIPRAATFSVLISSYAKVDPEKSLEVLQWMMKLYQMEPKTFPAPNTFCFNGLLDAWARSGRRDAGQRAEQTLEWMQQLRDSEDLETIPNQISYNSCIHAWANSPVPDAAMHAEAILQKMITLHRNGSDVAPSNVSFGSAMNAWANSGYPDAPERVANLLELMKVLEKESTALKVDSYSYASLLKAWEVMGQKNTKRKSTECITHILAVLHQMQLDGIEKTAPIYNSAIMAMASFSLPSAILYFLEVETQYRDGNAKIDVRTFNSVLSMMALFNKSDVAERSKDILARMWEYSKADPNVRPNQTTSNIMLKILSRSPTPDSALMADEMLWEMECSKSFETSQVGYVTVIIAWGRSTDESKFERVQKLLQRYSKAAQAGSITNPSSAHIYNAALSVCQHNSDDKWKAKALETVWFTLEQLRQSKAAKPDQTTYLTLFQALNRLLDNDSVKRHTAFEREFANCIHDGLVSRPILEALYVGSLDLFEKLIGPGQTPETAIMPHNWTKRLRLRETSK